MRVIYYLLLLQCYIFLVTSEDAPESKDLGDEEYDDLGRKHRKKKKHQNNPCYGGYGKTFGEKFGPHDYTYAPVTNYFFGCGGAVPVHPYPVGVNNQHGHGHHSHSHGGHGGHGGHGSYGGYGGQANYGYNPGYNQPYLNNHQFNRPFQNVVSAAAAGFGNAFGNYFNRPRKFNKQVNQYLRPLYNLF